MKELKKKKKKKKDGVLKDESIDERFMEVL